MYYCYQYEWRKQLQAVQPIQPKPRLRGAFGNVGPEWFGSKGSEVRKIHSCKSLHASAVVIRGRSSSACSSERDLCASAKSIFNRASSSDCAGCGNRSSVATNASFVEAAYKGVEGSLEYEEPCDRLAFARADI